MKSVGAKTKQVSVPDRVSIPLFILVETGQIATELKLQKLVFQVQNSARIPGGYRYFKHRYGPYSRELSMDCSTLANQGLIEKERVLGGRYPYSMFKITPFGKAYVDSVLNKTFTKKSIRRMRKVLDEYKAYGHYELAELVYRQWKIKQPERINSEIKDLAKDLQAVADFWESISIPECPAIVYFLAFIEYSQDALSKAASTKDTVVRSVLLNACSELCDNLSDIANVCSKEDVCPLDAEKGLCRNPDPSLFEVFSFIEDFCERNKVLPRLLNRDLEEMMTEDEYKRLQTAFKTYDTSSSS